MKTIFSVLSLVVIILLSSSINNTTSAQGVGIETLNPLATLHVAGTLRVDTLKSFPQATKIMVVDSQNVVRTVPVDSIRRSSAAVSYFSASNEAQTSTTSSTPQTRVTLNLPAGKYVIFAYFEAYNTGYDAGARATFRGGATELGWGIVYSNTSTYGTWSSFAIVSPTVTTAYTLLYSTWPAGSTTFVRRARLVALKIG